LDKKHMKTLEKLRAKAYWLLDSAKGKPIKKKLDDIFFIFNNWESPEVIEKCEIQLDNILKYSVENIEFYKQFHDFKSIKDFPIINKNIIRDNENRFLNPKYKKESLFKQETSGSTGTPFVVYQDPIKRIRATADTLFFSQLAKYNLGSRLYFSRVWNEPTKRSKLTCLMQNWIMHEASNLSDNDLFSFINTLENDKSTKSVILFASTLAAIANYLENNDIKPKAKVQSFITISEGLSNRVKSIIQKRFNTTVVSRYSDRELGIIAQQCVHENNEFHINVASFYVELLDLEKDEPVQLGNPGRIVVTDYYNYAMPIIRYDTGDIAIGKENAICDFKVPVFSRIEGRRVDFLFDTKGSLLSPYVINTPMHEFLEIKQYQFIQNGEKDYNLILNLREEGVFTKQRELKEMLISFFGPDANIKFQYVSEIPKLKSGKRKQVINNYKNL